MDISRALDHYPGNIKEISEYLDSLNHNERLLACRSLSPQNQAHLFELARDYQAIDLEFFVPSSTEPLAQVIHHGRNSLPVFRFFQKRFCLPNQETPEPQRWGYNEQAMITATGPGYFVAKNTDWGEVVIDYYQTPPAKPNSWPPILPNTEKLSRFIYYHTQDFMRGVSKHVSIGRAVKEGSLMNNWFVLCREENAPQAS